MDESRECSSPATETLKSYKFIMKHFGNKTNKTKIVVRGCWTWCPFLMMRMSCMANMSIKEPWETPGRSQSEYLHNSDLSDIPSSRHIYYKLKVFMYYRCIPSSLLPGLTFIITIWHSILYFIHILQERWLSFKQVLVAGFNMNDPELLKLCLGLDLISPRSS